LSASEAMFSREALLPKLKLLRTRSHNMTLINKTKFLNADD